MTSDEGHRRGHEGPAGPAMLHTVVALRWQRPRFAAELASRVLDAAAERGDGETWVGAAGWLLYGRAAVGDARETASDLLADMDRRVGADALRAPGAARLRVELAALAQGNGDPDVARELVDDWAPAGPDADRDRVELELDRLAVLVRCALVDGADDLTVLRADVEAVAGRLDGSAAALAELLLGSVHRDDGEPAAAAERALRGLARLGWSPDEPMSAPLSPHLGCALLSQWVTAVLEDGSAADIPDGVKQLVVTDGGRHGVLWRLAVARAFAGRARPTAEVLEDAAAAAAEVDAPSLEAACRSAQAELFEGAGRFQEALGAVRSAMAAERTDRERARRLRDALAGPVASVAGPAAVESGEPPPIGPAGPAPAVGLGLDERAGTTSSAEVSIDRFAGTEPSAEAGVDGFAGTEPSAEVGVDARAEPWSAGRHVVHERAPAELLDALGGDVRPPADPPVGLGAPSDPLVPDVSLPGAAPRSSDVPGASRSGPADVSVGSATTDARTGAAGPAMATLGAALRDVTPVPAGGIVDEHGPAPVTPDPAGIGGLAVDPTAGEGSPLADEVLGELLSGSHRPPGPSSAGPGVPGGPLVIALDLVDDGGRPVDHRDAAAVTQGLIARAARLVPPGAEVHGPPDGGGAHERSVIVSLPDAGETVARLWARSLVDHIAPRVPRRGLPDGTGLAALVTGSAGQLGDAFSRALTGPTEETESGSNGTAQDVSPRNGARRGAGGGSPLATSLGELDVRPGSGGRRRRSADAAGTDEAGAGSVGSHRAPSGGSPSARNGHRDVGSTGAPLNGVRSNGSMVDRRPRHGSLPDGPGHGAGDAVRNGDAVRALSAPEGWTIEGPAENEPGPVVNGRSAPDEDPANATVAATDAGDTGQPTDAGDTGQPTDGAGTVLDRHRSRRDRGTGDDGPGPADGADDKGNDVGAGDDGADRFRRGRHVRGGGEPRPGRRRRAVHPGEDTGDAAMPEPPAATGLVRDDALTDGPTESDAPVAAATTDVPVAPIDPLDPGVPLSEIGAAWVDPSAGSVGSVARPDVPGRPTPGVPRAGRHGGPAGDALEDPTAVPERRADDDAAPFSGQIAGIDPTTPRAGRNGRSSALAAVSGPAAVPDTGPGPQTGMSVGSARPDAETDGGSGAETAGSGAEAAVVPGVHAVGGSGAEAAAVPGTHVVSGSGAGAAGGSGVAATLGSGVGADAGSGAEVVTERDAQPVSGSGAEAARGSGAEAVTGADAATTASGAGDDAATSPAGGGGRTEPVRRNRRASGGRRPGRGGREHTSSTNGADPTAIPDDLGLGDLLAGALAAYRDI